MEINITIKSIYEGLWSWIQWLAAAGNRCWSKKDDVNLRREVQINEIVFLTFTFLKGMNK